LATQVHSYGTPADPTVLEGAQVLDEAERLAVSFKSRGAPKMVAQYSSRRKQDEDDAAVAAAAAEVAAITASAAGGKKKGARKKGKKATKESAGALAADADGRNSPESAFGPLEGERASSPELLGAFGGERLAVTQTTHAGGGIITADMEVVRRYLLMNRRTKMHLHANLRTHDAKQHGSWDLPRWAAFKAVRSGWFDLAVMCVIVANIVVLMTDAPAAEPAVGVAGPASCGASWQDYANLAFVLVYWVELGLYALADGFWWPTNATYPAYLSGAANKLDLFIVVAGTVDVALTFSGCGAGGALGLSALRAVRALRALKFVRHLDALRLVVQVIVAALPALGSVLAICLMVIAIYVVLGMELYSGVLNRGCYWDANGTQVAVRSCGTHPTAHSCAANQTCFSAERAAFYNLPPPVAPFGGLLSFDNAGFGFYTVFAVITLEGWTGIMYAMNDAVGTGGNWLYFVSLVLLGGYFLASLVTGVLAGLYVKESTLAKQRAAAGRFQGDVTVDVTVPREKHRPWAARLVDGGPVAGTIMLAIVANAGFLALEKAHHAPPLPVGAQLGGGGLGWPTGTQARRLEWEEEDTAWDAMLSTANYAFVAFFSAELLVKNFAYGPRYYWTSAFDVFDGVITLVSVAELVAIEAVSSDLGDGLGLRVFRSLRLFRVLRLTTAWETLRAHSMGAVKSLNGLAALVVLILLYLWVVALVGMQLFGGKRGFSARTNFDGFRSSLITSFQVQTAEGWDEIMLEAVESAGGADSAGGALAGLFFVVLVCFGHFLLFGVLLAIAYQNLEEMTPRQPTRKLSAVDIHHRAFAASADDRSAVQASACGCIGPANGLRASCHSLMRSRYFDPVVLLLIMGSSICLAAEDYRRPDARRNKVLAAFDVVFTVLFLGEMAVKMVALGLVWHRRAYFRSGWNWLDFVVVASSVAGVAITYSGTAATGGAGALGAVRMVRALRLLRPFRAVERSPGMKRVVTAMFDSVHHIVGLLALAALLLFCFSVMGVTLFKEQFGACTDPTAAHEYECVGNFTAEVSATAGGLAVANYTVVGVREWTTPYLNFDTSYKGAQALVSIFGFEEWQSIYHNAADVTKPFEAPVLNNKQQNVLFFVCYLIFVGLFFVNVVMAFVVLTYTKQADELYTQTGLTRQQVDCLRYCLSVKQPHDPYRHRRRKKFVADHRNGTEFVLDRTGYPIRGQ
jgi:voltage-dependent calcium channel L type alpha-1D